MLNDSSEIIRRKTFETITEIRQRGMSEIRKLQLPNLILCAEQYHELIDWNLSQVTEPPIFPILVPMNWSKFTKKEVLEQ